MSKLKFLFFLSIAAFFSCGEPEEDMNQVDEFDIVGKWTFASVSGSGQIFGVPQSDKDDNPVGYIEFYENGLGFSDFSIELLSQTIAKQETIQWERMDLIIDIEEEDGAHEIWTLINANESMIEADWFLDFGTGNQATVTMELTR